MATNVIPLPGGPERGSGVAAGGSGPRDPTMEVRVAVLEQIAKQNSESLTAMRTDLSEMRKEMRSSFESGRDRHDRDFRITFGAIIAVALGLATLVARGFKWL